MLGYFQLSGAKEGNRAPVICPQHSRRSLAKENRTVFALRDRLPDTRVLVSFHLPMQTLTSVSETSTTASRARSASTHRGLLPASARTVTTRLAQSASVRIHPLTGGGSRAEMFKGPEQAAGPVRMTGTFQDASLIVR